MIALLKSAFEFTKSSWRKMAELLKPISGVYIALIAMYVIFLLVSLAVVNFEVLQFLYNLGVLYGN